jgi:hypothetical protein
MAWPSRRFLLVSATVATVAVSSDAYAYLDPGTGSMILQAVVAGALGSAFAIKMFWQRIVGFFKGRMNRSADE